MTSHPLFEAWLSRSDANKPVLTWEDNMTFLYLAGFTGLDDPRLVGVPCPDRVYKLEDIATLSRDPLTAEEEKELRSELTADNAAWGHFWASPPGAPLTESVPRKLWNQMSPVSQRFLENAANKRGHPNA